MKTCETCKFNKGITLPPCPGRFDDGVNCASLAKAKFMDANDPGNLAVQELKEKGFQNLFRTERLDPGCECDFWEQAETGS